MGWLWNKRRTPRRPSWDLDTPVLDWGPGIPWTVRDSFCGTYMFGSTGSGKSSGSLAFICRSLLKAGYGGVFLTAKRDDRATYERYVKDTQRWDDLRVFSPDTRLRFNFIASEIEASRDAVGLAENLSALVMLAAQLGERSSGGRASTSENSEYFRQAANRLCRHAMLVLVLSGLGVTVPNLHCLIVSSPRSRVEARSESWQTSSYCWRCVQAAAHAPMTPSLRADFELALAFFMDEWSDLAQKTRSTVESTLTAATDSLSRGAVRDMMSAPDSNFACSELYDGAVVIADFPSLVLRDVGVLIQGLFKYSLQRALGRRDVSRQPRPVFIVTDESHLLLTPDIDQQFATTRRSSHTAVVCATQGVANLLDAFGPHGEAKAHSYLSCYQTLINHQQTDPKTIEYLQHLIGRSRQYFMNSSSGRGGGWLDPLFGDTDGGSTGFSETMDWELEARHLNSLARGGPPHWHTEAILFQGGRRFPNGKTWYPVTITQRR